MDYFLNNRKLFWVCLAASCVSHVLSMLFVQNQRLQCISAPLIQTTTATLFDLTRAEWDEIIIPSFENPQPDERKQINSRPLATVPLTPHKIFFPFHPPTAPPSPASFFLSSEMLLESEPILRAPQKLPPPRSHSSSLPIEDLCELLKHQAPNLASSPSADPHSEPSVPMQMGNLSYRPPQPLCPKISYSSDCLPIVKDQITRAFKPLILKVGSAPFCPPSLSDLHAISCSDAFDLEIAFTPLENQEIYLFALTLIPKPQFEFSKLQQSYNFLIDCSNSIQKERLAATKNAILKALDELNMEDRFNLIAFDSRLEKLYPAPKPVSSSSIEAAKIFLGKVQLGNFFSPANLYKPLLLSLPPQEEEEDVIHTLILLTDGETLSKKSTQKDLALQWTAYNHGRAALFTVGMNNDAQAATLDAIVSLNRGKTYYAPVKRGIKRKLLKLIKTISHPIAKDVSIRAVKLEPDTEVSLLPQSRPLPNLYLHEPYVILGTVPSLEPFILFLQAKGKDGWLNIKKTVSFTNAKKANSSLKAQWALQNAYDIYKRYFSDPNPAHIAEAKTLLEPYNLEVAFQ